MAKKLRTRALPQVTLTDDDATALVRLVELGRQLFVIGDCDPDGEENVQAIAQLNRHLRQLWLRAARRLEDSDVFVRALEQMAARRRRA